MKAKFNWDILLYPLIPFALCGCCLLGLFTCSNPLKSGYCGTHPVPEGQRKARLAREEARRKDTPIPLPNPRPRALTAPPPSSSEISSWEPTTGLQRLSGKECEDRWMCTQELSPLFAKLPPEIRTQIYISVFQKRSPLIHTFRLAGQQRLGHLRCWQNCHGADPGSASCWRGRLDGFLDWTPKCQGDRTDGDLLPLLRSCRKVYIEAINLLYSSQTFVMWNLDTMKCFSSTVLPQRLSAVRKLHFTYILELSGHPADIADLDEWERVCETLSRMEGLEQLRIAINQDMPFGIPQTLVLIPLDAVTGVKDFEVSINWQIHDRKFTENRPFRLIENMRITDRFHV